jgi:3-dehydroquinate synthase
MEGLKKIQVNLEERSYDIFIGYDKFTYLPRLLRKLDLGDTAVIITNRKIKNLLYKKITTSLKNLNIDLKFIEVPDSEKSKSIKYLVKVITEVARIDIRKRIFIIALGGGVVGDLAGFVAGIYKRGVPYIQVPTTLLAQVDSSIGGKVAVDLPAGKNLVGAFYQPSLVYSDIAVLSTLSKREVLSGLAEVIKYAVSIDSDLFEFIEHNHYKILELDKSSLDYIISSSAKIKARIVSDDEKEQKGTRTILNFGHTIGHALEAASGYSKEYSHGEAVAIGMICAAEIANRLGICDKKTLSRLESIISRVGLPVCIEKLPLDKIMKAFAHDKKFISGRNRLVLLHKIGRVKVYEDLDEKVIKAVLKMRMKNK